jgi:pantetheine-phosphate adenylyltransferase
MTTAVYPGSFDPATYGHLDLIERASRFFDRVVVGVLLNSAKSPLFSVEERVNILKNATRRFPNVEVRSFEGLSVNFARNNHAQVIVRGLRAVTDFEYELQMAQTNRVLAPEIDTLFLTTRLEYAYVSSTIMKEVAGFGGDLSGFAPPEITEAVMNKIRHKERSISDEQQD